MATALDPTELNYLLECGICLSRFHDPRCLPCLHSYCLECLKSHVSSNKDTDGSFQCPQCREQCKLPDGGVENYPKNFFVNSMKDILPQCLLRGSQETPKDSAEVMCKHHDGDGEEGHGEAVIYCAQCDANLCQLCAKHHERFTKDHEVIQTSSEKHRADINVSGHCEVHKNMTINWYCKTCSLPVCPECLIEKHTTHDSKRLVEIEATFKLDMSDVSKMAAKRIQHLQKMSADIKVNQENMEEDLDGVSKDISQTADDLCKLIRQQEATLQGQVKQIREEARVYFKQAENNLHTAIENTSSLRSRTESLYQTPSEQALGIVLQAPIAKQQYLHQQEIAVPRVNWGMQKQFCPRGEPRESAGFIGSVESKISTKFHTTFQAQNVSFEGCSHVTQLDYKDDKAVCSVTPIYDSMICVAHSREKGIWVYSKDGKLQRKIDFPGLESVTGMVAVNEKTGKLAVVNNRHSKLHFVTLSADLTARHQTEKLPIIPYRISLNHEDELVVCNRDNRVIVFNLDGHIVSDIRLSVPSESFSIFALQQTKLGFVVCDKDDKKVYSLDTKGLIVNASSACPSPWHVCQTSWGHILVADCDNHCINVLTEAGEFLGKATDDVNTLQYPYFIHANEADRVLYVGCGPVGAMEVRIYKFETIDFPVLPVTDHIRDISVNVQLIKA